MDSYPTGDGPVSDPHVRTLLAAAAAPVETAGPLPGEGEALAAFRAVQQDSGRTLKPSRLVSAKAAAASALGAGVLLAGGVGAAVAGVLPGASQETVSGWLDTVGISVPAGERAEENDGPRGRVEQAPDEAAEENAASRGSEKTPAEEAELPPAANHGKRVSDTAKDSTAEGADKGKEIARVASDHRGKSGDRDSDQTPPGEKRPGEKRPGEKGPGEKDRKPPESAPNPHRTGTAPDAAGSKHNPGPPTTGQ